MNLRSLLLFIAFNTVTAQGGFGGFDWQNMTKNLWDDVSEKMQAVECDDGTRAESQCNVAPFSGTFVCREFGSIFGEPVLHTVCAQNVVQGMTVGFDTDSCGCCPDDDGNRACPTACPCSCGEGKVEVDVQMLGFLKFKRCVTNGWSRHTTAWGNAVKCTETCESDFEDGDGSD